MGLSLKNCQMRFGNYDLVESIKGADLNAMHWQGNYDDESGSSIAWGHEDIDPYNEKMLLENFACWSMLRVNLFRKFYAIGWDGRASQIRSVGLTTDILTESADLERQAQKDIPHTTMERFAEIKENAPDQPNPSSSTEKARTNSPLSENERKPPRTSGPDVETLMEITEVLLSASNSATLIGIGAGTGIDRMSTSNESLIKQPRHSKIQRIVLPRLHHLTQR